MTNTNTWLERGKMMTAKLSEALNLRKSKILLKKKQTANFDLSGAHYPGICTHIKEFFKYHSWRIKAIGRLSLHHSKNTNTIKAGPIVNFVMQYCTVVPRLRDGFFYYSLVFYLS
jgi:hypothetical protein